MHTPSSERPFIIRPVTGMYFTTYNRDMGEITMEPAYHGIKEETVTRLPSKVFDEFSQGPRQAGAADRPGPYRHGARLAMRFASPRRAWSGDVLDGSRLRPSRPSTSGCHFVRGTPRNTDIGRIT